MKIVVLDGYPLNPGDLSWHEFQQLGTLEIYERTPPNLVVECARDAELVLTNKTPIPGESLRRLKSLQYIGVLATGYNIVDVQTAREQGVVVSNVPHYGTYSVAQFAFALLLELCHQVKMHHDAVKAGEWSRRPDFSFWLTPQMELAGKTLGIVGLGQIGSQVARIGVAFGMNVMFTSWTASGKPVENFPRQVTLDELLASADVVSLHCPLTKETHGLIDADRLALMKPTAFLINTSRGQLVVEQDLAESLNAGRLAGAAVDVLSTEPPDTSNPLLAAKNCIITPHVAWATQAARARIMKVAFENVAAFLRGQPQNVVKL